MECVSARIWPNGHLLREGHSVADQLGKHYWLLVNGLVACSCEARRKDSSIGALTNRIGFGGISCYNYNKELPKSYR